MINHKKKALTLGEFITSFYDLRDRTFVRFVRHGCNSPAKRKDNVRAGVVAAPRRIGSAGVNPWMNCLSGLNQR